MLPSAAALLILGECFSSLNPGHVWSRLWRLTGRARAGPVGPRLAGTTPVFLDLASLSAPVRITSADLQHADDARAGTASATFSPPGGDAVVAIKVVFSDQVTETIWIAPEVTTGSQAPWRLDIGMVKHRTGGPSPAKP